jgi:hypothetical protein
MIAELADARRDLAPDGPLEPPIVEKRHVLRPGKPDHDAQAVARGCVEQVAPWRRVGADRVDAEAGHQPEVFIDPVKRGELVARRVGREGAVRHAFDEKPIAPTGRCRAEVARQRRRNA